jgi:hypothetical protein
MPNRALPADTTVDAARIQMAVWERLGPAGRVELAFRMSEDVRRLAEAGVRHRHPNYSNQQVHAAVTRLMLGDALFRAAYAGAELLPS